MTDVAATRGTVAVSERWRRMAGPAVTIGSIALLTAALHVRDPHEQGSWGGCPTYTIFGVYCPGCGGLRAVNDLTRGHVLGAASSNLLFIAALPFVVLLLGRWALDRWRGTRRGTPAWLTPTVAYAGGVVIVLFTVLRNLPGSWLAP